jgi:hypothetical protein
MVTILHTLTTEILFEDKTKTLRELVLENLPFLSNADLSGVIGLLNASNIWGSGER